MDKELFQTALRVLQQINKRQPVQAGDEALLRSSAPQNYTGLDLDQIAVAIIQSHLRKKPQ